MQALIDPKDIKTEVSEVVKSTSSFAVKNDDGLKKATTYLIWIVEVKKKVKIACDPEVEKAHKKHKEETSKRKALLDPLEEIEKQLKDSILAYHQILLKEQRERERIANEELAKIAQDRKDDLLVQAGTSNEWDAELLKEQAAEIKPITVDVQKKIIEQEGLSIAQNWKFEIINESLIPRGYLMPDEIALGKLAKGEKEKAIVPGVRFFNAGSVRV